MASRSLSTPPAALLLGLVLLQCCALSALSFQLMVPTGVAPTDGRRHLKEGLDIVTVNSASAVDEGPQTRSYGRRSLKTAAPAWTKLTKTASSSKDSYILPRAADVTTTAILTVGDHVPKIGGNGTYRLTGIPDGMGAVRINATHFLLVVNHELRPDVSIVRTHGAKGGFVSQWVIDSRTMTVVAGGDLIQKVFLWNNGSWVQNMAYPFARFCAGELPRTWAFQFGSLGTSDALFMNGEETGEPGKAFAHVVTGPFAGNSYELPYMGRDSWENVVPSPHSQRKTIVIGLDDNGGQHMAVYVYVGEKKFMKPGMNPVEAAGLNFGKLYAVKVTGMASEPALEVPAPTTFTLVDVTKAVMDNVVKGTGDVNASRAFNAFVAANNATHFLRPEDGQWNPNVKGEFYFVTTASIAGISKLWKMKFHNWTEPELGGEISVELAGAAEIPTNGTGPSLPKMMDNLGIHMGKAYIQEDTGSSVIWARIFEFTLATKSLRILAVHDPNVFVAPGPVSPTTAITSDEESSGIFSLDGVMPYKGCHIIAQQTHSAIGLAPEDAAELVEGGQLTVMCTGQK